MKTNFLKSSLPIGAFVLAIAGAFAADVKNAEEARPPITGWASLPGQPACSTSVPCRTEVNTQMCTILHNGVTYDAFEKDPITGQSTDKRYYRLN